MDVIAYQSVSMAMVSLTEPASDGAPASTSREILRLSFTQGQHDETTFQVNDDSLPLQVSEDELLLAWANGFCMWGTVRLVRIYALERLIMWVGGRGTMTSERD